MPKSTKLALVGGGKIGEAIAALLDASGDYEVTVIDRDEERLAAFSAAGMRTLKSELRNEKELARLLSGHEVVISACPFHLTPLIAGAARQENLHYFDLTEDVESTRTVMRIAERATTAFVPQCGLAPGFVSIAAHSVSRGFESLRDVRMRVGALPLYPSNALKYNLSWSTDGLINEYCMPCEAIVDGAVCEVPPLEDVEELSLDGVTYEAFNTSGGLGTLCETLTGRVENLNYKTIRYLGHRNFVKFLIQDLRLGERRELLRDVLEAAIPTTSQDVVLVLVTISGRKRGQFRQETFARKIFARQIKGKLYSAIQLTTAAGVCTMVDLVTAGAIPDRGFVRQEQATLEMFLGNRFGRHFDDEPWADWNAHSPLPDTGIAANVAVDPYPPRRMGRS